MRHYDRGTLDCQGCGDVLKVLTPGEAQRVALRPYDFVVYCTICVKDHI